MPERTLSRQEVYGARPTIRVDGATSAKVTELVTAMQVEESEGGLSALELRLENVARHADGTMDLAFEDEALIGFGTAIALYSGDEDAPQEIFRGLVTGVEGLYGPGEAPQLVVMAEDALQRARLVRRTRVHAAADLPALIGELAGTLGLAPRIDGLGGSLGLQVQLDETDLAFVRRLLAARDGDLQVVGEELHASPRGSVRRGAVELGLGSQLIRARVTADLAHQTTRVTVGGWDAAQGRRVAGTGTGANLGPGAGRRGADALRAVIDERHEHLRDVPATSDDEAQAIADAVFDRRARRFVRVDATCQGNPGLRVGTHVELRGLGPRFDNTYYVVRARHRFDLVRGYETDFEAECAYLGGP